MFYRFNHWTMASPWLSGINPRDLIMPEDGDDGYFPTSGNELVNSTSDTPLIVFF